MAQIRTKRLNVSQSQQNFCYLCHVFTPNNDEAATIIQVRSQPPAGARQTRLEFLSRQVRNSEPQPGARDPGQMLLAYIRKIWLKLGINDQSTETHYSTDCHWMDLSVFSHLLTLELYWSYKVRQAPDPTNCDFKLD